MQSLARNQTQITYRLYTGFTETVDAEGNYTGEKPPTYADPVTIWASVSAARGTADLDMFGVNLSYTNTVIVDDPDCPIDEHSKLEIDGKPYAVVRVAKSLNHIAYAVMRVNELTALTNRPVSG